MNEISENNDSSSNEGSSKFLKLAACFTALGLAIAYIQIVAWRDYVGWDAVQYLEIADQVLAGHWNELFRSYWSPLFPLLLALMKTIAGRGADELFILNCSSYLSFVFASLAFIVFATKLLFVQQQCLREESGAFISLSPTQLTIAFFTTFLYSALAVTELTWKTPDMLGSGICLLALSQCLSLLAGPTSVGRCALTGFLIALSYWAKNFNVGFATLLAGTLIVERKRNNLSWKNLTVLVGTFLICFSALAVPLSLQAGRPTFSDVTFIGRSWCQMFGHLNIVHSREASFLHPDRILVDEPRIYEFAQPFDVTYPPFYAPQYWYDGVQFTFRPEKYFPNLFTKLVKIFWVLLGVLILATAVCAIAAKGIPFSLHRSVKYFTTWFPSFAAMCACILLADHQGRYYSGPLIALLCFYFACLRLPDTNAGRKALSICFSTLIFWMSISLFAKTFINFYFACPSFAHAFTEMAKTKGPPSPPESPHLSMIDGLKQLGLKPGDRVARIMRLGEGDAEIYWAKATGLKIVCESIDVDGFWACDPEKRQIAYQKMKELGVKAVVQDWAAGFRTYPVPVDPGWTQLPGTKSHVYILK